MVVSRGLLRVEGGRDKPEVLAAIAAAAGHLDGARRCWWLPASRLRSFLSRLQAGQ